MGIMRAKKYEWFIYESRPRAQVKDGREGYAILYFLTLFFKFNAQFASKMHF